jgi:hypothetical protein
VARPFGSGTRMLEMSFLTEGENQRGNEKSERVCAETGKGQVGGGLMAELSSWDGSRQGTRAERATRASVRARGSPLRARESNAPPALGAASRFC